MPALEELDLVDTMGEEPIEQPPVQGPVEEHNIAEDLDEDELKHIAEKVIKDYETDLDSREEWEDMHAEWLKLFYQTDEATNEPWNNASKEGFPVFTEAVNQFQSRSYKAFFPNRYFIEAIPVGQSNRDARERGERIADHMNFQLGVLDRTYKVNKNQMFMAVALHGSDFTKTYFSHIKRRTIIERVRALDLVVPYHVGPIRIEELPRKTHVKYQTINETKILEKLGYFLQAGQPHDQDDDKAGSAQEAIEDRQGLSDSYDYSYDERPALTLEQHCLLDLDDDGIAEPYIVWVDKSSRKVQRIQIRYEVDEYGAPVKDKEPIEYFTHYQFMPNPDGFYGLGLGHLLGKLNKAINKLSRMFIDAGELSTVGNLTYLISDALGLPGDEFELSLGKGIKIPRSVDDIRKHFMKLDFRGPGPELASMIQQMVEAAQRVSSSSDILAGQPDKVYQPHALLTMLEQGLQLYSSVQEFIGYSMEDELNKVYRLNAKYMTTEEYYYEGDRQITVAPEDYQDDFRIVPVFDPKYSTRSQKLARAEAAYQFALQDPLAQQNPQTLWLAGKQYLEALDVEELEEFYPPPEVPQVARIDDQNLENAYYLMPPDKRPLFDVFGDQDHLKHIEVIDKFISFLDGGQPLEVPNMEGGDPGISRLVASMSNEQKEELVANLLRHRSQHLAYMYGQMNGAMDEQGEALDGNNGGQGPDGDMALAPGDEESLAGLMQVLQTIQ